VPIPNIYTGALVDWMTTWMLDFINRYMFSHKLFNSPYFMIHLNFVLISEMGKTSLLGHFDKSHTMTLTSV